LRCSGLYEEAKGGRTRGARWKFLKPLALRQKRNLEPMGMTSPVFGPKRWLGKFARLVRRQSFLFVAASVLIGFVLVGMAALDVYLHRLLVEEGAQSARNLSYNLSDQADRTLQSVLSTVSKVVERLESDGVNSIGALESAAGAKDVQALVRERLAEDRSLDGVFIVGADGKIGNSDRAPLVSIANLHGEDHLDSLRDASPEAVYVSTPFQSAASGTWQLSLSKRVSARDGTFLGVVNGVVKLPSLDDALEKVALGEHASVSIFREDGTIIACFPQREIAFGANIADGDVYSRFIAPKRDGVTRQSNAIDGVDRLLAIVHSPKFPVASVVAVAMNDVLAGWLHQAEALAFGAAVIVLAIAFGTIRLAVYIERLADAQARASVQTQLAVQYKRFHDAVDNIVQGLAMYDRRKSLIACNKRYAEIYGLPDALTGPGVTRAEIVAYRGSHGFGKPLSEPRKEPDGSVLIVSELPDGRIIAQRKKKLADGGWVSTHEDITTRHQAEEAVRQMAMSDALTGLLNRIEFKQRLEQCLEEARRHIGKYAVLHLDLDQFKVVNETLGHPLGDKLLREVAARIKAVTRKADTIARVGGDEFAIVQRVLNGPRDAALLAERLIASVSKPYTIDGNDIQIGASAGISLTPDDSFDGDELIRNADMALYQAKAIRGSYNFFKPAMDEQIRARRNMDNDLRVALAEAQFELNFQPVVSTADRQVNSFEALLRWRHPERGSVPPSEFIPVAEENGQIVPIGEWVLRQACREAAKWPAHINVAVNVSAVQLRSPGILQTISEAIEDAGIDGSRLIVEVTESVMITNAEQAIATLHAIRNMGGVIAMDDFGTGYSSLSYLRRFPFDKIKIDQSFVSELGQREDSAAIVRAATGLAKALGMEAIAEGVETEEQLALVAAEGCAEVQGYLISRPMPAPDVFAYLGVEPREAAGRRAAKLSPSARQGAANEPFRVSTRAAPASPVWRDGGVVAATASLAMGMRSPER
jgi:diguanylate cyclase (GGDEF)-like protein